MTWHSALAVHVNQPPLYPMPRCCQTNGVRLMQRRVCHFRVLKQPAMPHAQAQAQTAGARPSPGVPTPYRAMMRHLLGGDYHSPGASEAWSPVRESPARSQQDAAASEGSPATPIAAASTLECQRSLRTVVQDCSSDGQRMLAPASAVQSLASASNGEEELLAAQQAVVIATVQQPVALDIEAKQRPDNDSGQPLVSSVTEAESHGQTAGDVQPATPTMSAAAALSPALAAASSPMAAGERGVAVQPLSAVPTRLQGRALPAPPGTAGSPGAGALIQSPGSEFDTPTAGEEP